MDEQERRWERLAAAGVDPVEAAAKLQRSRCRRGEHSFVPLVGAPHFLRPNEQGLTTLIQLTLCPCGLDGFRHVERVDTCVPDSFKRTSLPVRGAGWCFLIVGSNEDCYYTPSFVITFHDPIYSPINPYELMLKRGNYALFSAFIHPASGSSHSLVPVLIPKGVELHWCIEAPPGTKFSFHPR